MVLVEEEVTDEDMDEITDMFRMEDASSDDDTDDESQDDDDDGEDSDKPTPKSKGGKDR